MCVICDNQYEHELLCFTEQRWIEMGNEKVGNDGKGNESEDRGLINSE